MLTNYQVGILDMHKGFPNQGMRCIQEIVTNFHPLDKRLCPVVYDVRGKDQVPNIHDHDIYISSGGPGTPFDGIHKKWEKLYFRFLEQIWAHNHNPNNSRKKYVFFICYSYQMLCRFFEIAMISERSSTSFGIYRVYKTVAGHQDRLLEGLPNPYFAVDSRDWQLTHPDYHQITEIGAKIISLERVTPNTDFERALMALRISDELVGTQFHPEAEPLSMIAYFGKEEKRREIIKIYGEETYRRMMVRMDDPQKIAITHQTILPNFLKNATSKLQIEG